MTDIPPETKVLYFSKEDEVKWTERLHRISYAYDETEFRTFYNDMRDIYIYHVNSMDFDRSYNFLREFNLIYYPTNRSGIYSGFSHKHMPVKPGEPFTLYGAVVKNGRQKIGEAFLEANAKPDHVKIGKMLGYPDCCIKFFSEVWGKDSVDPIYEAALHTEEALIDGNKVTINAHPYANQMLRYFGVRITPHLTHSMQCKKSIEMGNKWFKIMSDVDKDAAIWAKELLSMPSTWDCYGGVAIIDTPIFRGITNSDMQYKRKIVVNNGWNM